MNSKTTIAGIIIASLTMALIPTILSTNYAFAQATENRASDRNPVKENPITTTEVGPKEPVTNPRGIVTGQTQDTTTTTESCTTHGGQTPSGLAPEDGGCRGGGDVNENAPQHEESTTVCTQTFNPSGTQETGQPKCTTTTTN